MDNNCFQWLYNISEPVLKTQIQIFGQIFLSYPITKIDVRLTKIERGQVHLFFQDVSPDLIITNKRLVNWQVSKGKK